MAVLGETAFAIVAAEAAHNGYNLERFPLGRRVLEAAETAEIPPRWPETVLPLPPLNSREIELIRQYGSGHVPASLATRERDAKAIYADRRSIQRRLRVTSDEHAIWLGIELGLPVAPPRWSPEGRPPAGEMLLLGLGARGWRMTDVARRFTMDRASFSRSINRCRETLHAETMCHAIGVAARRRLLVPDYELIPQWHDDAPGQM